ncbi:MAG: hypothetical protein QOE19_2775 [Actinomycetota bacterium]|nr:hypothetical protein [Actinomycetota bacterium]
MNVSAAQRTSIRFPRSDPSRLSQSGGGGRCMTPGSGGSTAIAMAGRPSVTRLSHRICNGRSGIGVPSNGPRTITATSARLPLRIADELANVIENDAALAHGADDGREVVVLQHYVSGILGDVGAHDAHGDADFGLL